MAKATSIVPGPRPANAVELQAIVRAEREGAPFFVYRAPDGRLEIVAIPPDGRELTVGRNPAADLSLSWDEQVSALHAVLEPLAGELTVVDDGLSRNGSYVNGERVQGRRRLRDRDQLRFGQTLVQVRNPGDVSRSVTEVAPQARLAAQLSDQQRKVLIALCRPLRGGKPLASPATNQQIANELHLSIPAVKLQLRTLSDKLGIGGLPQNKKRFALAVTALQAGLIAERELGGDQGSEPAS
jgi:pSer/pThr/pTyr-binding forkhead associated (FHA) protein